MFKTQQLVQSALIAATVAAAAPVYADASFATGGYARFAPAVRSVHNDPGSPVAAHSGPTFATGGYARLVAESNGGLVSDPVPTHVNPQPSFATGGFARAVVSDAGTATDRRVYRVAGYPWDNGGYKSDGWRAPEARG